MNANEMPGAVTITSFNFLAAENTTNQSWSSFKIHVGHTDKGSISTTFIENYSGNTPQLVYSIGTMTVSTVAKEWFGWKFNPPFKYNGTSNLIIELSYDNPKGSISIHAGNGTKRCVFKNNLSSPTGDFLGNDMAMRLYYKSNTPIISNRKHITNNLSIRLTTTHVSTPIPQFFNNKSMHVSLYTITGKAVKLRDQVISNNHFTCGIKQLPSGLYTLIIACDGIQYKGKFCLLR